MAEIKFTILLNPITKKNSGQIISVHGRPMIIPSQQYKAYERSATPFCPCLSIDYPINIQATYFMATRRRVDITNLESALMDVLVHAGTLADDNCTIVVSTDGSRVMYDKNNPRTEVVITTSEDACKEFIKNDKR